MHYCELCIPIHEQFLYLDLFAIKDDCPTNAHIHLSKYINQKSLTVVLTIKRPAGITEVYLGNPLQAGDQACKWGIHNDFEMQGRRHQKSKIGVSVVPQRGLMYSKIFQKRC